ncbi:adenylate kinase [Prochlorothrix hollandica]|uniref:Adenylate kinase n=1 Tax=Prochlorothrix hollandica PCC 9006 = CALU 1027 TaxID=317619 RepID=A0A0M2PRS3_PROHO|nr:adenylate kinase [Prochlorothrix hollandica]KKI98854.1 adenylate kinase [Prochlorothrix hollandica PCC 9006 = CALU 1027]
MARLIFLGPPGAGKGTQAAIVAESLSLAHISTGEILRSAVRQGTPLGQEANTYMAKGDLVPDTVVLGLVKESLQQLTPDQKGWILDGFPRNYSQAQALDGILVDISQSSDCAINLDVIDDILISRLLSRGRQDDSESVVRNRLQVYRDQTAPLIDFYESRNHLVSINGSAQVDEVTRRIQEAIQQRVAV